MTVFAGPLISQAWAVNRSGICRVHRRTYWTVSALLCESYLLPLLLLLLLLLLPPLLLLLLLLVLVLLVLVLVLVLVAALALVSVAVVVLVLLQLLLQLLDTSTSNTPAIPPPLPLLPLLLLHDSGSVDPGSRVDFLPYESQNWMKRIVHVPIELPKKKSVFLVSFNLPLKPTPWKPKWCSTRFISNHPSCKVFEGSTLLS